MGFRSLPQVLWSNLAATVHVRARKVVIGSNLTLTDSGQGVVTIASTGGGASALDDLTDVVITSPSNGQVLKYDGAEWINDTDATGGGSSGIITVANGPGSATIPALSPVYWYDQDGAGHLSVATLTGSDPTKVLLGLLLEDLTVGGTAQCQTEGLVQNIDTSGFSIGDYLFASTTGTLTSITAGLTIRHFVGLVLESNATTGKLQLSDIGSNLDSKPRHGHYGYNDGGPLEHAQFNEFDLSALATPPSGQHVVGVHIGTSHWSRLDSAGIVHDLEAGGGSGTVTSVAATVPTGFSVSGSPVTTTGTLGITLDSQTANKVLASATSGGTATPAFRALVAADIPAIAESGVTSLVTDLGLKAPIASPTFTGITTAPEFSASGLTGATAASRYVGATASGAPVSGTFAVGDWAPDQTGKRWTCTVGGTPGTWVQEPGTGGSGDVATDVIWDAKGDLAVGTGANTAAKLTVGADDTIPMADAAATTGMKWVGSQTPSTQAFGDSAAQGTADTYARGDHVHGMPAAPASSALTLIGSQTLSGTAASVTFSSIPGTYNNLQLWCLVWTNSGDAVGTDTLWMRFNSDSTTAHYGSVAMYGGAIGPGNDATTTDTKLTLGVNEVGGTVSPYAFTPFIIDIPFYTQTTTIKPVFARTFRIDAVGTNLLMKHSIANWNQTSAITQIDLLPSAGSFIIGCKFWLYGAS